MTIRLLAITPPDGTPDPDRVDAWRGVAVLLRSPGLGAQGTLADARLLPLRDACRRAGTPMLLSCSPSEVSATWCRDGIVGLQLRADPSADELRAARAALGTAVLGRSVHGEPDGLHELVDYSCFAPVFVPRTGAAKTPGGLEALRRYAAAGGHVLALGGITADNAPACLDAGASGLASIACFFSDPPAVAAALADSLVG